MKEGSEFMSSYKVISFTKMYLLLCPGDLFDNVSSSTKKEVSLV